MNSKAFTLVELLGVIIVLTLITIIIFPKIASSVKSKQKDAADVNKKVIFSATELYLRNNYDVNELESGTKFCIEISTLEEQEYLKDTKDIYKDESISNKVVFAEYDYGFTYKLYNSLEGCNARAEK